MTLAELHNIPNFSGLFEDIRFKGLIHYLQANPEPTSNKGTGDATTIIRSEGAFQGWYECIKTALQTIPKAPAVPEPKKSPAYANPQPQKTESK